MKLYIIISTFHLRDYVLCLLTSLRTGNATCTAGYLFQYLKFKGSNKGIKHWSFLSCISITILLKVSQSIKSLMSFLTPKVEHNFVNL